MTPEERVAQAYGTIPDLIWHHAAERPGHAALVHDARSLDYRALDALMDRVAAALQREGLEAGEAIAICAASSIEYLVVFLGALRAGIAVAPIAPSMTAGSLAAMVADCGAKHLFLDQDVATTIEAAHSIVVPRVALDGSAAGSGFNQWLAPEGAQPKAVTIPPHAPFNIIYSPGTTGAPKGIVQPHAMRWAHVQRGPVYGYGAATIILIATPLHAGGPTAVTVQINASGR
jgi:long-chain acyl-CoA synthetase